MTGHDVGDVRELDRGAPATTGKVVAQVAAADLDRPTPCARWSLGHLLEHLVNENRGYAASSMGAPAIVSIWYSAQLSPDPYEAFLASAARVNAAFAAPGLLTDSFEVREFGYFPAPTAIGMHFVDILVHGWDVATSLGIPYHPDEESTAAALAIVAGWPRAGRRSSEFGRRVTVPDDASDFARLLGLLGRQPRTRPRVLCLHGVRWHSRVRGKEREWHGCLCSPGMRPKNSTRCTRFSGYGKVDTRPWWPRPPLAP